MPETYTHNDGRGFYVAPTPFSTSVNKCTGCALHATKYQVGCGDALRVCASFLRSDHRDMILVKDLPAT